MLNKKKPKEISKEEQDRLDNEKELNSLMIFSDSSQLIPGYVVYIIEEIKPNKDKPYSTFRPVPRVITQIINSSDSKNGSVFLSYKPIIQKDPAFNDNIMVKAEEDSFYTPLTKEQATYVCKILNEQMKHYYEKKVKNNIINNKLLGR